MFQREVALRIVATPAERADYGRLAVLAGWRTQARILFDVPPAAFTPPPKVTSSVVELVPRAAPDPCDPRRCRRSTQAAFGQRRKMLRQSLKAFAAARGLDLAALLARRRPRADHAGGGGRRRRVSWPWRARPRGSTGRKQSRDVVFYSLRRPDRSPEAAPITPPRGRSRYDDSPQSPGLRSRWPSSPRSRARVRAGPWR